MEEKYKEIISFLKDYQEHTHTKGYVLGISGGKDSTVVAKLLVDAISRENVLGVLMPNGEQKDISDSIKVCKFLNIRYNTVNIRNIYFSFLKETMPFGRVFALDKWAAGDNFRQYCYSISDKAKTNIPPRIRMTILYAIAQSLGYLVAGTGNKSERFIGWFTKWGDGACDINPIAHLTCAEVIELGDYLGLPYELVHKIPEDGLTGKSDEENFGFTYSDLQNVIEGRNSLVSEDIYDKIWELHRSAKHKFSIPIIGDYNP